MENELVERMPNGEYALYAPQTVYKHMALGLGNGRESDEETGRFQSFCIMTQKNSGDTTDSEQSRRIRWSSCTGSKTPIGTKRL